MAERANDEILQLAGQGNLQALSVYLNRHLIPSGAHVKVKQREDALHILIVVISESENAGLINSVQQLLTKLKPAQVKRVKVYTQVLGQKQASLRQQFSMASFVAEPQPPKASAPPRIVNAPQPQSRIERQPSEFQRPESGETLIKTSKASHSNSSARNQAESSPKEPRYSVADFLTQATNLEDLKILHDHPFFTGICPHCQHPHAKTNVPPTYWDCPRCGWKDDLSQVMPHSNAYHDGSQTSITESKRLGDYLIEAGLVTASQVEVALADQLTTQLRFGEVLIRRGWVKEETIEYLMQKVILPERRGQRNEASYLESSRNLLKTLLKIRSSSKVPNSLFISPPTDPVENVAPPQPLTPQSITSISHDTPSSVVPKTPRLPSGKLANERETLILPDVELDELDAYLNNGQDKKKP